LVNKGSNLKLFYYTLLSERVIINGIASFSHWPVLLLCYLKKNLIIYLHEAAPHAEPFAKKSPMKFKAFVRLLNRKKVAFVSDWQRQYFLNFTAIPTYRIIYNNMNFPYEQPLDREIKTIAMIGYQSKYKNVSFFSAVADAAAKRNLPYRFVWIGGEGGEMKQLYHSENVAWLGDQEHIMDSLNAIDLLLFTSYGDTFGLVLTEALFKGKRIVSYKENGLAPFLYKLKGCRIYETFEEALVLNLIDQVLHEEIDLKEHKELATYLCSMENFKTRLDELFDLPV
jgi:glycosyltransferase involved in cell wall biosynthesis